MYQFAYSCMTKFLLYDILGEAESDQGLLGTVAYWEIKYKCTQLAEGKHLILIMIADI